MKKKAFDCVEMKNAIQAKLRKEYEGLTPEEVNEKRREKLATSDDVVARKWRRLAQAEEDRKAKTTR